MASPGDIPESIGCLVRLQRLNLSYNTFSGPLPANLSSCVSLLSLDLSRNKLHGRIAHHSNMTSLNYLGLGKNQLEGPIPPELGSIGGLQALILSENNLSGVLPYSLYNLSLLKTFSVTVNMLSGTIPDDIGNRFPNIEFINFSSNRFHGTIPPSVSNLSALATLALTDNNFSGYVPSTLGRLHALIGLYLQQNRLEANDREGWEFVTMLANCSHLQRLVLRDNSFSGKLPSSIANLSTTLKVLDVSGNRISGSIPPNIDNLVGLEILGMFNTSISGVIPQSIGRLKNLGVLGIYNSSLSGLIPLSLGNLTKLNILFAYYGNLEGPIPASLGKLKNLIVLDLSTNRLNGSLSGNIPDSIGNCASLEWLMLDHNSFEGSIPQSLKNLQGLALLNLTMNKLTGNIPDALSSIGGLKQLYLAHNNLSGLIPSGLQNLMSLSKLDLSFNNLQGEVPKGGIFANATYMSIYGNDELCGGTPQLRLTPCYMPVMEKKRKMPKSLLVTLTSIGALVFLVLVLALIWLIHKKLKERQKSQLIPTLEDQYERVSYHALSNGTNGFSKDYLLGQGSYGMVYKCTLHDQNMTIAVKVFNIQQSGSTRSFEAECEALRRVCHRCLVKIITCCSSINHQGQEFKALVFEFMPNGSLNDWLHPKCLKPSNIILTEDLSARVGDFGISRILQQSSSNIVQNSNSTMGIKGSIGYYAEGSLVSTLGDVYSLGILLLEIFMGKSPIDEMFSDSLDLHKFAQDAFPERILEIVDPKIWIHTDANNNTMRSGIQNCMISIVALGISCSKKWPRERKQIQDVVIEMHAIRDSYLKYVRSLVVDH
ncbi:unnamed protein product [Urochloa decumbens]|uniref:Protein kinase domain-containing protein n=1 Tax=Urochloa decumbens TaxID=240449 RepID=A0ABC8ZA26_9POAL